LIGAIGEKDKQKAQVILGQFLNFNQTEKSFFMGLYPIH